MFDYLMIDFDIKRIVIGIRQADAVRYLFFYLVLFWFERRGEEMEMEEGHFKWGGFFSFWFLVGIREGRARANHKRRR